MDEKILTEDLTILRDLSLSKWEKIKGEIEEEGNFLGQSYFSYCSFCDSVMELEDLVFGCSTDGRECGQFCLINKEICGSEECLLVELENVLLKCNNAERFMNIVDSVIQLLETHPFQDDNHNKLIGE